MTSSGFIHINVICVFANAVFVREDLCLSLFHFSAEGVSHVPAHSQRRRVISSKHARKQSKRLHNRFSRRWKMLRMFSQRSLSRDSSSVPSHHHHHLCRVDSRHSGPGTDELPQGSSSGVCERAQQRLNVEMQT